MIRSNFGPIFRIFSLLCSLMSVSILLSSLSKDLYEEYVFVISSISYSAIMISASIIPYKNLFEIKEHFRNKKKVNIALLLIHGLMIVLPFAFLHNGALNTYFIIIIYHIANFLRINYAKVIHNEHYNLYHFLEAAPAVIFLCLLIFLNFSNNADIDLILTSYVFSQFFTSTLGFFVSKGMTWNYQEVSSLGSKTHVSIFQRNVIANFVISFSANTAVTFPILISFYLISSANVMAYSLLNIAIQSLNLFITSYMTPLLNKSRRQMSVLKLNLIIILVLGIAFFLCEMIGGLLLTKFSDDLVTEDVDFITSTFVILLPFNYLFCAASIKKKRLLSLNQGEIVAKVYVISLIISVSGSLVAAKYLNVDIFMCFKALYFTSIFLLIMRDNRYENQGS